MKTNLRILEAADRLFYTQGVEATSFAHIAGVVKISRGNFYYHFKTKDEIVAGVVAARAEAQAQQLVRWSEHASDPKERLKLYVKDLLVHWVDVKQYGSSQANLVGELVRMHHTAAPAAQQMVVDLKNWLAQQFQAMGVVREAEAYAMHVIASVHGAASLAQACADEKFIWHEVTTLCDWVDMVTGRVDAL